jgi:hypothetical protein
VVKLGLCGRWSPRLGRQRSRRWSSTAIAAAVARVGGGTRRVGDAREAEAARGLTHGAGEGEDGVVHDGEGEPRLLRMRGSCVMSVAWIRRRAQGGEDGRACEEVTQTT